MANLETAEIYLLYKKGASMPDLAKKFDVNKSTIKYHIDKFETKLDEAKSTIKTYIQASKYDSNFDLAATLGNLFYNMSGWYYPQTESTYNQLRAIVDKELSTEFKIKVKGPTKQGQRLIAITKLYSVWGLNDWIGNQNKLSGTWELDKETDEFILIIEKEIGKKDE